MTEAEILELRLGMADSILAVFSTFFAIVSAYVAGLYFFLNRAPILLRITAFVLLSLGLLFMGLLAVGIKIFGDGILTAWKNLPAHTAPLDQLSGPIIFGGTTVDFYTISVAFGWLVATLVYLALFILTFLYNWKHQDTPGRLN